MKFLINKLIFEHPRDDGTFRKNFRVEIGHLGDFVPQTQNKPKLV